MGQEHSLNLPEGETSRLLWDKGVGPHFLELRKQVSPNTEGVEGTKTCS